MTAEILEFPLRAAEIDEGLYLMSCECGSDVFRILSDQRVRCAVCDSLVAFWNEIQPEVS